VRVRASQYFRQTVNSLIVLPTLVLILQQQPQARLFALVALGRHQGRTVMKAMHSELEATVRISIRTRASKPARSKC